MNTKRQAILKFLAGILLLAFALQNVTGQEKSEDRTMDQEAIKTVLEKYVATWNQNDMEGWGKLFTEDVDYINRAGGWWKSNKENVEGHELIHTMLVKQNQKMTYKSSVEKITFLNPDVALVHATWQWPGFKLPSGEELKDFNGIITMVMVKQEAGWFIRALQNTVITAPSKQKSLKNKR